MHPQRSGIECFYIKRENDGKGFIQFELVDKTTKRIEEILRHNNRLDATVCKHIREAKEKYLINR